MARTVAIGIQDFQDIREKNCFYIDKTSFIKEWWESEDSVTLITRPRRFGKTLNLSMIECFFSNKYAGRKDLFEDLLIWEEEYYRQIQGTFPVISLTFASIKETTFEKAKTQIFQLLENLYRKYRFLLEGDFLDDGEKEYFHNVNVHMKETTASVALHNLSGYLSRYYHKKVIVLLDEYDTPMQEAYVYGYWQELVEFTRSLFHVTFKTNPYLERGMMTGITRVSKESMFSDLNHMKVVTTTSKEYASAFGFTEKEVFQALEEQGMNEYKQEVKRWYDGFVFGDTADIYNPWSVINYLKTGELKAYWVNTSSNSLANKLIREGDTQIKRVMEDLLAGKALYINMDEQIIFNQLDCSVSAVWSLFLASGYLKATEHTLDAKYGVEYYRLEITNFEVKVMFQTMISQWFQSKGSSYNDFVKALLAGDKKAMNAYMNQVSLTTFSYFDTGNTPSFNAPERFYHGFVLGLMVDLQEKYRITSNRESGFGRYDVMLEPLQENLDAIIIEFKVHDEEEEKSLADTVQAALKQIAEKEYDSSLTSKGIRKEHIRHYGFAFQGKRVLIG